LGEVVQVMARNEAAIENIDMSIRLLVSYGLEAIDMALVVELLRQSL